MSGDSAAAMLADLIGAAGYAHVLAPAAKAANPANRKQQPEPARGLPVCGALRNPAIAPPTEQAFAVVRSPLDGPKSEGSRGPSQISQRSQWVGAMQPIDLSAVAWTDADVAAFTERRSRLIRWGWSAEDADRLAERLVMRDRAGDDRASCIECKHGRPGRCGQPMKAGLHGPELGRDLAGHLQRCPAFETQE